MCEANWQIYECTRGTITTDDLIKVSTRCVKLMTKYILELCLDLRLADGHRATRAQYSVAIERTLGTNCFGQIEELARVVTIV